MFASFTIKLVKCLPKRKEDQGYHAFIHSYNFLTFSLQCSRLRCSIHTSLHSATGFSSYQRSRNIPNPTEDGILNRLQDASWSLREEQKLYSKSSLVLSKESLQTWHVGVFVLEPGEFSPLVRTAAFVFGSVPKQSQINSDAVKLVVRKQMASIFKITFNGSSPKTGEFKQFCPKKEPHSVYSHVTHTHTFFCVKVN